MTEMKNIQVGSSERVNKWFERIFLGILSATFLATVVITSIGVFEMNSIVGKMFIYSLGYIGFITHIYGFSIYLQMVNKDD